MSDPEVPQNEQPHDVDDVVGRANEGLDAAAAARADVPGSGAEPDHVDPDEAAFAEAERDHPGTFVAPDDEIGQTPETDFSTASSEQAVASEDTRTPEVVEPWPTDAEIDDSSTAGAHAGWSTDATDDPGVDAETSVMPASVAHAAYTTDADAPASAETQVVAMEPVAPPPAAAPQPIFVQAPEPPRELGNRGAAGAIGLLAALSFAILYLGAILGFGALRGEVTAENIGQAALAPLTTWSFWVPVATFFLAFWLLGAFINRARWGKWVIFGILVAAATYGGHLLGQLFQAPFWRITATESAELVNEQMLAPLAIAAFVFARELTIWFGAWVARSGARKKRLNAEAQEEYERTLEAGPAALR